ncbi:WD40-repeat-containing domain protein [Scheffersomyces coipomensis]|uniref:WD40-repeat-containing domain protein n=1 Tax=Scheffersomyces coipomensis TaxID=1788519 RepID=UPI00315DEBB2
MIPDEFILQLIQQSLNDLGYSKISDDLGNEIKSKRLAITNSNSNTGLSSSSSSSTKSIHVERAQIKLINWFNDELKAGNYLTIESYLLAVLQNIDNTNTTNTYSNNQEVNFIDVLVTTQDPKTTVSIILYLIRRVSFLESYMLQSSTESPQVFIRYLTDRLMPLLDDLAPKLSDATSSLTNHHHDVIKPDVDIDHHDGDDVTGSGDADIDDEFNYSSDNEYNFNPSISTSNSVADLTNIFGKSVLSSLTREKESNLLLGFALDFKNLLSSSSSSSSSSTDSSLISTFLSKYLFNLSNLFNPNNYTPIISNNTTGSVNLEHIILIIRETLITKILDKIFKLNDKLKTFNHFYNVPPNYLKKIIENSNNYQKHQNPYFLPPRTKFDLDNNINPTNTNSTKNIDLDPFLLGTANPNLNSNSNSNLKHLNHFFKSTYFPNKLLHSLNYHTDEVWFTKFSPSGNFLVSGSLDGKLIIYDVLNEFKVLKILESSTLLDNQALVPFSSKPTSEKSKAVIYCCWDPQERYLVSCCLDTVVRVWYVDEIHNLSAAATASKRRKRTSSSTTTITSKNEPISSASNITTGNATSTESGFRLVSCFTLGQEIKTWTCEFLPNLNNSNRPQFVIGSPDKVLKGFDVDGVELFDFYANIEEDDEDDEVDVHNHSGLNTDGDNKPKVSSSASEPRPSSIGASTATGAANDKEGDVQMKDEYDNDDGDKSKTASSNIKKKLESSFNRINDITITPDGKFLITADSDHQLHFYKIPNVFNQESSTKRVASIILTGRLTSCSISKNGKYLLVSSAPEELQVWDISGLSIGDYNPILYRKYFGHSQSGYIIRSSFGYLVDNSSDSLDNNEEQLILTGSDTGYIYFFKLHTGQLITRVKGHNGLCNCVDWNRFGKQSHANSIDYGKLWSSVGDDKLVKIWGPF